MTFAEAVSKARRAALDAWNAQQAGVASRSDRDVALAAAFGERPGGMSWAAVVAEVNAGLPRDARLSVRTARLAWERYRPGKVEAS